jgi:hypothetical protein
MITCMTFYRIALATSSGRTNTELFYVCGGGWGDWIKLFLLIRPGKRP